MGVALANNRVALFRAEDDARKTAERLAALGFEAVIAPVMAPVAMEPVLPGGLFDAMIATSAKALDLAHPDLLATFADTPLYVVGAAGEAAAARHGRSVCLSAGDSADLAQVVTAALPKKGRVLYLAGAFRKPEFEKAMIHAGLSVVVLEIYVARARTGWSAAEAQAVASCRAALHYSRRSAELALDLAASAEIWPQWQAMKHVVISIDAAEPFGALGVETIVAHAAREDFMLAALTRPSP